MFELKHKEKKVKLPFLGETMYVLDCISSGDLPKKQNNTMAKEKDEDGKFDIFLVKKKFYSANAVDRASGKVSKAKVVEF